MVESIINFFKIKHSVSIKLKKEEQSVVLKGVWAWTFLLNATMWVVIFLLDIIKLFIK